MKNKFLTLIAIFFLLTRANAQLVIDISTGSTNGSQLPVTSVDDTWSQVTMPDGTVQPVYVSNGNTSNGLTINSPYAINNCGRWVSPNVVIPPVSTFGTIIHDGASGTHVYQMSFSYHMPGCATSAFFDLSFVGADNDLVSLIVNGTTIDIPGTVDFNPLTSGLLIPVPPALIQPGTNTIQAVVQNDQAYTGLFLCGSLRINVGIWNNTTANTAFEDIGNDVLVTPAGDVFVGGTFKQKTEFKHTTCANVVATASDANYHAYIAKYSSCGELLWVNYDKGLGNSRGTGLAYDRERDQVYLAGAATASSMSFLSNPATPCGITPVPVSSMPPRSYFIATFNGSSGNSIDLNHRVIAQAVTMKNVYIDVRNVNDASTDIYISTSYTTMTDQEAMVTKINEAGLVYTPVWTMNSLASALGAKTVNDLALDPVLDRLYITGTFTSNIGFGSTTLTSVATSDAFVWEFNTTGSGSSVAGKKFGVSVAGRSAEGTSIIKGTSAIYATGFFNTDVNNAYGSGFNLVGGTGYRSYVASLANGLSGNWVKEIRTASTGYIKTTGIAFSDLLNQVIVTGTITAGITSPTAMVSNSFYSSATSGAPKTWVGSFTTTGGAAWGTATKDNTASSIHTSTKIAALGDRCYSTGSYTNEMDYAFSSTPVGSGPLMATPANKANTYIVRNNLSVNGGFFKTSVNEKNEGVPALSSVAKTVNVFPNPSQGLFTIDLGAQGAIEDAGIEVYDLSGKRIMEHTIKAGGNSYSLDLSSYPKGIYLVKINRNNTIETHQVQLQ